MSTLTVTRRLYAELDYGHCVIVRLSDLEDYCKEGDNMPDGVALVWLTDAEFEELSDV